MQTQIRGHRDTVVPDSLPYSFFPLCSSWEDKAFGFYTQLFLIIELGLKWLRAYGDFLRTIEPSNFDSRRMS